jgi:hypothetical protein
LWTEVTGLCYSSDICKEQDRQVKFTYHEWHDYKRIYEQIMNIDSKIRKDAATQSGFDNNQAQECENLICTHPGENATCVQEGVVVTPTPTLTSTPIPIPPGSTATLNVCKVVVDRTGNNRQPSDFQFTFITPADPISFAGSNTGCVAVTVAPGQYAFIEEFNFTPTVGMGNGISTAGGCEARSAGFGGTIAPGETQTCTITNTLTPPR